MKKIEKKEKRKTKEPGCNAMCYAIGRCNAMLNETVSWSNAMINEAMNKQVCCKMVGVWE